jgi:hypothetical protein
MRVVELIVAAVILVGCSTSGTKIDPAKVATFKPGVTTYEDVKAAMGEPTSTFLAQDGSRTVAYGYSQVRTNPATFVPIVGLFAGGADVHTETTTFRFGPDGVLKGPPGS